MSRWPLMVREARTIGNHAEREAALMRMAELLVAVTGSEHEERELIAICDAVDAYDNAVRQMDRPAINDNGRWGQTR